VIGSSGMDFIYFSLYSLFHGFSDQQAQRPLLGRS
jgi:hypothetical protein